MRKAILAVVAASTAALCVAGAAAQSSAANVLHRNAVPSVVGYLFNMSDANRDGYLTEAEAGAGHQAYINARDQRRRMRLLRGDPNALFLAMDGDRNGSISRGEFDRYSQTLARLHSANRASTGNRPARMGLRLDGSRFRRGDANKDGRLSLAEANAMGIYYFDWMDGDKNAQVTSAEYRTWRDARASRASTRAR